MFKVQFRRRAVVAAAALATAASLMLATPAQAAEPRQRVDLRVLVFNDGTAGVDLVQAQLDREGVPYDAIALGPNRTPITAAYLADSVGGVRRAKYQGIVMPNEESVIGAEATVLADFEREFKVRRILAYTGPKPAVGLTNVAEGVLDGTELLVTNAGKSAGFGYLAGALRIDDRAPGVGESYGYLSAAAAGATFTPLVNGSLGGSTGSLFGVYAHDGREELVVTLAANRYQTHAMELGHGLVTWLTKGVHLGHWRNWFSVHIDDIFLPDDRWHTEANCTVGDDCNPAHDPEVSPYNTPIRMVPDDVTAMLGWQQRNGIKLDMVFNGDGSVEAGASDPLTASLLANKSQLRWLNHTFSHAYLGCVQNFSVVPWRCTTDASGQIVWVSQAEITAQIKNNADWARGKGIAFDASELVTGEHSGLRSLPQVPTDNPNLAPALNNTGVRYIASDASREQTSRPVGGAVTAPRFPMNIYYNVATTAEAVDEYNWIYTSRANGGSGICEDNSTTSTCIAPLSTTTGFTGYIVPMESRIAYDHVVSTNPAPHYAHQSNLTEDRVLYPVLESVLTRYRSTFAATAPLLNPRFAEGAQQNRRQAAWRQAVNDRTVEAYTLDGRVVITNRGTGALDVPVTVPAGTRVVTLSLLGIELLGEEYGEAYGGERSAWRTLPRSGQLLLRLPG